MGAKRYPNKLQEGEVHDAIWCARSQIWPMQICDYMPYKCYSIHLNEVLDKYFYYNPKMFICMCCLLLGSISNLVIFSAVTFSIG